MSNTILVVDGAIFDSANSAKYGKVRVVSVNGSSVKIEFLNTGFSSTVSKGNLIKGLVKDYSLPNLYGQGCNTLGFMGKGSKDLVTTKAYKKWQEMMKRCYNTKFLVNNTSYLGCTVAPEWKDFKNFLNWYVSKITHDIQLSYALDKDIIHEGNKLYSPETCVLVPKEINNFIVKPRHSSVGKDISIPHGVHLHKKTQRYQAYCNNPITGKRVSLKLFDTLEEAHFAHLKYKGEMAKHLASKHGAYLENSVIEKLKAMEVKCE